MDSVSKAAVAVHHYHFIGIGGIGMSGLARIALAKGYRVSGSDTKETAMIQSLREAGARIVVGHRAETLEHPDEVIISSAIRDDNPELCLAKQRNITVKRRAQLLNEFMKDREVISVTGAHGKTTTSSLIAHILIERDQDPMAVVGGIVQNWQSNIFMGRGKNFVAEVDDSDGSLLCFSPKYSVFTNMDFEHMDFYQTFQRLEETYLRYMRQTQPAGMIFINGDDERLLRLAKESGSRFLTFGFQSHNQIRARQIVCAEDHTDFLCEMGTADSGGIRIPFPGVHNVYNVLAALSVCRHVGVEWRDAAEAIRTFGGVGRRFQKIGECRDILVVDDYAHHPSEILQALQTAKCVADARGGRVIAVFQPHRFSRLQSLWNEFLHCFDQADCVVVTEVYSASENPISGVEGRKFAEELKKRLKQVIIYEKRDHIANCLRDLARSGDVVITLGAGDVNQIGYQFIQQGSGGI